MENLDIELFIKEFRYDNLREKDVNSEEEERKMLEAFKYLLKHDSLTVNDIKNVGNLINKGKHDGFRTTDVTAGDYALFEPVKKNEINIRLMYLLDNYKNQEGLDAFLSESIFLINFMKIHPFEYGNKRVAKLVLATNLCKNGINPIIIGNGDTEQFYNYINEKDYDGFAEFLENKAKVNNGKKLRS